MKAAGKKYEPITYDGAGHGFMRAGEDPTNPVPGNKTAREQAFARMVKLLKELKAAPVASTSEQSSPTAQKAAATECHESSPAAPSVASM